MARGGLTRRALLTGAAALAARPAMSAPGRFDGALRLATGIDLLHALVIAQNGDIVAAETFRGPPLDRPVNVKSVSKTLVSALTGAAIDRGELPGLDARAADFLPRMVPRRADPRVRRISIRQLLSMQSGLSPMAGASYGGWVSGSHWIYDALAAPMQADPGTTRQYSTANTHILGAVLTNATGLSLLDLANDRLGPPLETEFRPWTQEPQGYFLGGNDMALSPLAMVRFGETYRLGGTRAGHRLVTADFIEDSWQPRTTPDIAAHRYGLTWFIWPVEGMTAYYARGFGGQMIYTVPTLRLTVAMTSDITRPARADGHIATLNALLADAILPAAQD